MTRYYATTNAHKRAAMGLLKSGLVSLSEAAELAGVSRQLAYEWCKLDKLDWQSKRQKYLARTWAKRLAKENAAVEALR